VNDSLRALSHGSHRNGATSATETRRVTRHPVVHLTGQHQPRWIVQANGIYFHDSCQLLEVYQEIKVTPDLYSKFISAKSQRLLFTAVMDCATNDTGDQFAADNLCLKNHSLKPLIAQRFFNCVAKNLVQEITQKVNVGSTTSSKRRKMNKLQSVVISFMQTLNVDKLQLTHSRSLVKLNAHFENLHCIYNSSPFFFSIYFNIITQNNKHALHGLLCKRKQHRSE